jgi:hypothetical protein
MLIDIIRINVISISISISISIISINIISISIVSPISRNFETTRNSDICVHRREIHRDVDNFGIMCSFEMTWNRGD